MEELRLKHTKLLVLHLDINTCTMYMDKYISTSVRPAFENYILQQLANRVDRPDIQALLLYLNM